MKDFKTDMEKRIESMKLCREPDLGTPHPADFYENEAEDEYG